MTDVCRKQSSVPLKEARLLGSHDSGTSAITKHSRLSPDAPKIANRLQKVPLVGAAMESTVALWGKTQNLSLAHQLLHGVRYLDLRLCFLQGRWVLVHGKVGETLFACVEAVEAFLRQHPAEFIILHLLSSNPPLDRLNEVEATTLETELSPLLEKLVLRESFDSSKPLGSFAGLVMLLSHADPAVVPLPHIASSHLFHDVRYLANPWANQNTVEGLKQPLTEYAALCRKEGENRLFLLQLVLTPREDDVVRGVKARLKWKSKQHAACLHSLVAKNRDGLLQLARSLAVAPEQYRTNIVMVDFVEMFHEGVLGELGTVRCSLPA